MHQAGMDFVIMHQAGMDFDQGLANGIKDGSKGAQKAASDLGKSTVEAAAQGATAAAGSATSAGEVFGKSLATGITSSLGFITTSALSLASAATKEADAMLAKMGVLGQAGGGTSIIAGTPPITPASGPANQGGQGGGETHVHCYIDGRDITHTMRVEIKRNNDKLANSVGRQKR